MESQASPEFSDYVHAIGRRKALMLGVAIPIAILALLLSLTLPDVYTSSGLIEIDESSSSNPLDNSDEHDHTSYADHRNPHRIGRTVQTVDDSLSQHAGALYQRTIWIQMVSRMQHRYAAIHRW